MEKNSNSSWRTLKTVKRAADIIRLLVDLEGAGVSTVAEHLDMSVSSAHSHLATLYEVDYLVKEDGEYRLSYEYLMLGEYVRNSSPLFRFGRGEADELADKTGHYVHLYIEEKGLGVNIYESRGDSAGEYNYQSLKLQRREPLHITAAGKAVLANLEETTARNIVERHGLEQYTENTITSEAALFEELEQVQKQGYALNNEEEILGFKAVAAPVKAGTDDVVGSISVAGPTRAFGDEQLTEEISEQVVKAVNMIQVNINMSQSEP